MMKWNGSPVLIEFSGIVVRYYGLMFVLGFTLMGEYSKKRFIKYGKNPELTSSIINYMIIGMFVGARLGHCIFYDFDLYIKNPIEILKIWKGGLASHGGYLGVFISVWLYFKKNRELSFLWIMDIASGPCLFVGGLIRVGNFFNSEIVGLPTKVPWAIIFERVDNVPRHPAQLYEAIGYFTISFILFRMEQKKFLIWPRGFIFAVAIILSCLFRFFIEFTKAEQSSLSGSLPINMGQILSLAFSLIGVFFLVKVIKKNAGVTSPSH